MLSGVLNVLIACIKRMSVCHIQDAPDCQRDPYQVLLAAAPSACPERLCRFFGRALEGSFEASREVD